MTAAERFSSPIDKITVASRQIFQEQNGCKCNVVTLVSNYVTEVRETVLRELGIF